MSTSDQQLHQYFIAVDKDRSGQISADELGHALSNGTWQPFNPETVRLMIGMFDRDGTGTVNFDEFKNLWNYVNQWQRTFQQYDKDRSGFIDKNELKTAFNSFGYRLSDQFYNLIVKKFSRHGQKQIAFDDFIQLCVMLQALTAQFQQHDTQRNGTATLTYEQFLIMVFKVTMQR